MHRLAILGISGRMGSALIKALGSSGDAREAGSAKGARPSGAPDRFRLTGAVASAGSAALGRTLRIPENAAPVTVGANLAAALNDAEVAIDFSSASAVAGHAQGCASAGVPLLVATTGLDRATQEVLKQAALRIPLIVAPNTSLGVNLLTRLVALAAAALNDEFDIDVADVHHRNKLDAPSGTALKLGAALAAARGVDLERARFDTVAGGSRPRGSIAFTVRRAGDVVGEHTVSFSAAGEELHFTHAATDRECFARGALRAAGWLIGRPPGFYTMDEVLGLDIGVDSMRLHR